MQEIDELVETQKLQARLSEYWHDVDTNWGRNAGGYYTEDAVFETRRASYQGRKQIEEFYRWRVDQGPRVAVHAITNFRVAFHGDSHATSTWYLILFAMNGKPVLPTAPPIQIALMSDTCVKVAGQWLYSRRKFDTLFEGGVPVTNPVLAKG